MPLNPLLSKGSSRAYGLNKFSHASSALSHSAHRCKRLFFPDIYETSWFKEKGDLKIEEIQHRKEFDRPFYHEFILVRLNDGTYYRFDRRPDPEQPMEALRQDGADAHDSYQLVEDIERPPHPRSECIASLDFKDHCVARLSLILAVCSAISSDTQTQRYTLREFNCYFFSWTIIATVARYCVAWESVPYDTNFLCLPKDRLSRTIAQGITNELVKILPRALSLALPLAFPETLTANIPECVPVPLEYTRTLHGNYSQQLHLAFNSKSFLAKLSHISQQQHQVIVQTLKDPSTCEELQKAIESLVMRGDGRTHIDRGGLSILLRRLLWQRDVIDILSSGMDEWIERWCTPDNTDRIVGGRYVWDLASNILIKLISKNIEASISSRVAEQVDGIVGGILGVKLNSTLAPHQTALEPTVASIRTVVNDSILVITECNVRYAVSQVRENMTVARAAIQDSIIHTVENLFPAELPIGLQIPKAQNSSLRRLLWLARPESAFCLWRTPREIQDCELVKHQELQKYLSRRIEAHSRDVRILGGGSQEVEKSIRKAMSRVWLTGSMVVAGLSIHSDRSKLERGHITLYPVDVVVHEST